MSLLSVRDLSVRLGGRVVLEGVDLRVEPGEVVDILSARVGGAR